MSAGLVCYEMKQPMHPLALVGIKARAVCFLQGQGSLRGDDSKKIWTNVKHRFTVQFHLLTIIHDNDAL
jgi:hypothetical protein